MHWISPRSYWYTEAMKWVACYNKVREIWPSFEWVPHSPAMNLGPLGSPQLGLPTSRWGLAFSWNFNWSPLELMAARRGGSTVYSYKLALPSLYHPQISKFRAGILIHNPSVFKVSSKKFMATFGLVVHDWYGPETRSILLQHPRSWASVAPQETQLSGYLTLSSQGSWQL